MSSVSAAIRQAGARLRAAGVEQGMLDARLLLTAATGLPVEDIVRMPEAELPSSQAAVFEQMIARRAAREPVSRILGRREFWSLPFEISSDTLDPRPDSETLVSAVCDLIADPGAPLRILDIGTGSGCLLLSVLTELPRAQGVGIDVCSDALKIAARNAQSLGLAARVQWTQVDLRSADWESSVPAAFDIIVANPPYIKDDSIRDLAPEVTRFDPIIALAGGKDGLDFYRMITISLSQLLNPGGMAVLEVGAGQSEAVEDLVRLAGLAVLPARRDLGGVARAVIAQMPKKQLELQ